MPLRLTGRREPETIHTARSPSTFCPIYWDDQIYLNRDSLPSMVGRASQTPQTAFGLALKSARHAAGLSQESLAFEAELERNYISLLETGQNQPSITTIFKLAKALGLRPSELVDRTEKVLAGA
jgi:DNA-binding XRE family transcriptional regulator